MAGQTTSIHKLNADRGFNNKLQAVSYLLLNWINNLFPYTNVDSDLVIRDFVCDDLREYWDRLSVKTSPGRRLSDLFWLKLPWDDIRKELGEIHILDTGCGSGVWGPILLDYSNDRVATYTGLDIRKRDDWAKLEEEHDNFCFRQTKANDVSAYIPEGTNLFMTQSAIEHFDRDLSFFKQIRDYVLSCGKSVIQVHLFPSSSCLRLYRFHGVRQYTPRTVSRITRLFKDFSAAMLFRLGGRQCNRFHYERITKPLLILREQRKERGQEYESSLLMAIEQDMRNPQKFPVFYALVIHSNWKHQLVWAS